MWKHVQMEQLQFDHGYAVLVVYNQISPPLKNKALLNNGSDSFKIINNDPVRHISRCKHTKQRSAVFRPDVGKKSVQACIQNIVMLPVRRDQHFNRACTSNFCHVLPITPSFGQNTQQPACMRMQGGSRTRRRMTSPKLQEI